LGGGKKVEIAKIPSLRLLMKIYSVGGTSRRNVKFGFYNRDDNSVIRKMAHNATIQQSIAPFSQWGERNFYFDNFFINDEDSGELKEIRLTEKIFTLQFSNFKSMPDLFTTSNGSDLIASERFKELVESYPDTQSTFFPIKLFDKKYYYWFIMPDKTLINLEKSKIDWDSDLPHYAIREEEVFFEEREIGDRIAFRLPFSGNILGRYFFVEYFYETLIESGLNLSVSIYTQPNFRTE
jgi:hypothetical protein